MNAPLPLPSEQFQFHVNLADDWERRYLAARLGVSEEALRANSHSDDPTVEEIFDTYCPRPSATSLHRQLHQRQVAADASQGL
jgi:hypothetical protein